MNVHRIAHGGRNLEYISGEDAYLGVPLVGAYVRGMQRARVGAVVKHYAFNQQEHNRDSQDVVVSERTAWEGYYPPYVSAIEAGAVSVMCSYNQINGSHACGNANLLQRDLRERMGFDGWVMSDWWAAHESAYAAKGTDQNMPGNHHLFDRERIEGESLTSRSHTLPIILTHMSHPHFHPGISTLTFPPWHCHSGIVTPFSHPISPHLYHRVLLLNLTTRAQIGHGAPQDDGDPRAWSDASYRSARRHAIVLGGMFVRRVHQRSRGDLERSPGARTRNSRRLDRSAQE